MSVSLPNITLATADEQKLHCKILDLVREQAQTKGDPWTTTVGEVAAALCISPEVVAAHMRDAWLIDMVELGPSEAWTLYEDGE